MFQLDNFLLTIYCILGHVYSVTKVVSVQGFHLVRLRNPHGRTEWTGPWSDDADDWENLNDAEKLILEHKNLDEGEFYMSIDDFVKHFELLSICNLCHAWNEEKVLGSWVANESAGGFSSSTTNPKVCIN